MENIFLTSLTVPEVQKLLRQDREEFREEFFKEIKQIIRQAPTASTAVGDEKPVTGAEIAEFLHISSPTLIRWRDAGKVPHMRIGGRILYKKSEVLKALEQ